MTKLLFAFGMHEFGLPMGNKKFFRKAVVPFIEDQIREGKRVAVIFEMGYGEHMFTNALSDDQKWQATEQNGGTKRSNDFQIRRLFTKAESVVNSELAGSLGAGKGRGHLVDDWGFNGAISEINRRQPGRILSVVEPPPAPEALYSHWRAEILGRRIGKIGFWTEQRIELLKEWIRHEAQMVVLRDMALRELALGLSKSHQALVIPRGSVHRGMVCLFDPGSFDIRVKEDPRWRRIPLIDATEERYKGELGEAELLRYARLEAAYRGYFERMGLVSRANRILNFIAPGITRSEYEKAHEYAIRTELETQKPEIGKK